MAKMVFTAIMQCCLFNEVNILNRFVPTTCYYIQFDHGLLNVFTDDYVVTAIARIVVSAQWNIIIIRQINCYSQPY